jgi:subtilase-type serine protease
MIITGNWSRRARRLAFLLSGTAAIALLASEPVRAIVINDQVVGPQQAAVANYFDSTNVYSNVGLINFPGAPPTAGCTGTLINSRTVLTAAHCFIANDSSYMGGASSVSFSANTTAAGDA